MTSSYALESLDRGALRTHDEGQQPDDYVEPLTEEQIEAILDAEWPESDAYTDAELIEMAREYDANHAT